MHTPLPKNPWNSGPIQWAPGDVGLKPSAATRSDQGLFQKNRARGKQRVALEPPRATRVIFVFGGILPKKQETAQTPGHTKTDRTFAVFF